MHGLGKFVIQPHVCGDGPGRRPMLVKRGTFRFSSSFTSLHRYRTLPPQLPLKYATACGASLRRGHANAAPSHSAVASATSFFDLKAETPKGPYEFKVSLGVLVICNLVRRDAN